MSPADKPRPDCLPPEAELGERFILAGGPGGQHVNRTESGVQLRFDVRSTQFLDEATKTRLARLAGRRMDSRGILTLEAKSHRSQHRNREEVRARLAQLIEQARQPRRKRVPTRPGKAARKRRLEGKRHRARVKLARGKPGLDS